MDTKPSSELLQRRRIGILGGTFNPIHKGHLIMAEEVYQYHRLSKIIFIPTNIPPHKDAEYLANAQHRYQMVKEAIREYENFEVSDIEIKREGKSYTIDTIKEILIANTPSPDSRMGNIACEVFLILGSDSLQELVLWKNIKSLSELCYFVIVNRPGYTTNVPHTLTDIIGKDKSLDMERLRVEIEPVKISSTDIRKRVKMETTIRDLVPQCVEIYIREHGLYLPQS
ncbi:MAG: nicotinate-nucleotide adenylyltransferase [Candidatus Scalindua sp.]|nr:nicotinate-nucleotide adenylyltransferase [Candidatus Scalindua sp.]